MQSSRSPTVFTIKLFLLHFYPGCFAALPHVIKTWSQRSLLGRDEQLCKTHQTKSQEGQIRSKQRGSKLPSAQWEACGFKRTKASVLHADNWNQIRRSQRQHSSIQKYQGITLWEVSIQFHVFQLTKALWPTAKETLLVVGCLCVCSSGTISKHSPVI